MNHRERENCENRIKCETGREDVININMDVTGVLGKKERERQGKQREKGGEQRRRLERKVILRKIIAKYFRNLMKGNNPQIQKSNSSQDE